MLMIDRKVWLILFAVAVLNGCQSVANYNRPNVAPASLRDVPAQRFGFRFEPDVLVPPEVENSLSAVSQSEKSATIQADFDQHRAQDVLTRTVESPDKQRFLAIYQGVTDETGEFRLDLYDAGGKVIRKITPANLALVFPDSIAWSPDSGSAAFVAERRKNAPVNNQEIVQDAPRPPSLDNAASSPAPESSVAPSPSPVAASNNVLTFRTEQIYLINRDGGELKPLTQTDGLIYFNFVWSPDSTMICALGCKENEWNILEKKATDVGEIFKPSGRPRVLEKNGRERRLDDGLTNVMPVWSPDSSKIIAAYDKQIRVYDAIGNNPTTAAIPLQVPLLIASKICDEKVAARTSCVNQTNADAQQNQLPTQEPTTFLPIVALKWTDDKTLYLETGKFVDYPQGEPLRSFPRWHRLNFSSQAVSLK